MVITLEPFDRFWCFNFWLEALEKLYHLRLKWASGSSKCVNRASKRRIGSCLANTLTREGFYTDVRSTDQVSNLPFERREPVLNVTPESRVTRIGFESRSSPDRVPIPIWEALKVNRGHGVHTPKSPLSVISRWPSGSMLVQMSGVTHQNHSKQTFVYRESFLGCVYNKWSKCLSCCYVTQ